MALNDYKKKGGLFAGLANLSSEEVAVGTADSSVNKDNEQIQPPKNTLNTTIPDTVSKTITPSHEGLQESFAPQNANIINPPLVNASPSAAQRFTPQGTAPSEYNSQQVDVSFYNGSPYNAYDPMIKGVRQGSMQHANVPLIDGRYKRNPKSFRTCIALTEELHQNIERAKMTGRISSLNDLINNLLTDYFNLN